MPRTRSRSSARALTEASRASTSSARAAAGLSSMICPAASSVMPIATSRACAPSCRSRSIRRISAAPVSMASARVCGQVPDPQRQLGLPGRRQHRPGQQAVAAQQPRGRHSPTAMIATPSTARVAGCSPGRPEAGRRVHHRRDEQHDAHHHQPGGQHRQHPAHDQRSPVTHSRSRQVAGSVSSQPSRSAKLSFRVARGQRQVRIGDRHAAPLARQPPGQAGQPSYGQQRARPHGPADAQPSSDPQQGQQHTLVHQDPRCRRSGPRSRPRSGPGPRTRPPGARVPPAPARPAPAPAWRPPGSRPDQASVCCAAARSR